MKQRITIEQMNELSDEHKKKLKDMWEPTYGDLFWNGYFENIVDSVDGEYINCVTRDNDGCNHFELIKDCCPLLSIGQMTHLLYEEVNDWGIHYNDSGVFFTVYLSWNMETARMNGKLYSSDELVDALWDAVKAVL